MTPEEAIKKSKTGWWANHSSREIAEFQLQEPLLCMPFGDFHAAVERELGRPVFTHEFARPTALLAEMRKTNER